MKLKSLFAATVATLVIATPTLAEIIVSDPYARSSGPLAKSGAAFLMIENTSDQDDRLIGVTSDIAKRTELHTHLENEMGVMSMLHAEDGFVVLAGAYTKLNRGGKHVMFMGLNTAMEQGNEFTITLIFRDAGEITVTIPVDLERKPMESMGEMNHGS
ncbi:MAG: copper chaperone PCu(A)C [Paracoccaceae bacterium]|nr:copper chaperone PCu(A)C [Paracoccaceae bacterium]MDG1738902.1 copper chaperone PCu(A)C [Paracoccaceae bacterium]MDG2256926.1 copper chaperone PCu(A)C [Paracoccaceae bacterium]